MSIHERCGDCEGLCPECEGTGFLDEDLNPCTSDCDSAQECETCEGRGEL